MSKPAIIKDAEGFEIQLTPGAWNRLMLTVGLHETYEYEEEYALLDMESAERLVKYLQKWIADTESGQEVKAR